MGEMLSLTTVHVNIDDSHAGVIVCMHHFEFDNELKVYGHTCHTNVTTPQCNCVDTLQKQMVCFNHRVVTLVVDKLKKQWFCILYFADCKTTGEEASQIILQPGS